MNELRWVAIARGMIGTAEKVGKAENPKIVEMWNVGFNATGQSNRLKEKVWQTENTAWCGGFMSYVFAKAGLSKHIPKSFPLARSWQTAGTKLSKPAYGCVVVFTRGNMGHVGIVVGKDKAGNLMVLGGNQGDAVNIKPFSRSRVLAYRWLGDTTSPNESRYNLPTLNSNGKVSTNEA